MTAEREIKAKELVNDIIVDLADIELMHKYKLTFRGLQSVFRRLVELGILEETDLKGRLVPEVKDETTVITRLPRKDIFVPLPVQDADNPEVLGIVLNISERGLGVKGLKTEVDEVKRFIIMPGRFIELRPVTLKAKCRWVNAHDDPQEVLAGFEMVFIAKDQLLELKNLIETLDYMYR
jgi:hypothetical protein